MDISTTVTSLVVALIVVVAAYYIFSQTSFGSSHVLQGAIQDGKKPIKSKQVPQRSFDQKEGLTFSYTCWLKIDDFAYRYGEPKIVFVKGSEDLKSACPALLVDANSNSLLVKVDTFGGQETVSVPNIPSKKWLHVAIAADQDSIDVYINGTLYTHHTIMQLPKQNSMPVHTSVAGGFDGKIAKLEYYDYFLDPSGVQSAMKSTPQPDPNDVGGPLPPYFDMSWWTGRRS